MIHIPAELPFFEVSAPARSALPDLDSFSSSWHDSGPINSAAVPFIQTLINQVPSLDEVASLVSYSGGNWKPNNSPMPFIQNAFKQDFRVFGYLNGNLSLASVLAPPDLSKPGAAAEHHAWLASTNLFQAPQPPWSEQPTLGNMLTCEGVFNSVWLKSQWPKYFYVIDQLWVLSWGNNKILVAVEIDRPDKWEDDYTGDGRLSSKQRVIVRTEEFLRRNLLVYRLSSEKCATLAGATTEITRLWEKLSSARFLNRMNIGGVICSEDTAVTIMSMAKTEFLSNGNFLCP